MSISLIRERVKVTILRDTAGLERVSFGVPLFIGTTDIGQRVKAYKNLEEVAADYGISDPEYLAAITFYTQSPQPTDLIIGYKAAIETYTEALTAIRAENDDFFAVLIESRTDADALELAPVVSALPGLRQFWYVSSSADILDGAITTDIASQLKALNYDQARVIYHSNATLYPDLAIAGRVLPITENATSAPGTAAWHDQPVVGITGDSFTASQRSSLEDKNCEFFIDVASASRTMGGKMAGGEWGDVMHGLSWLDTRLSEDVYQVLASAADRLQKIQFTDAGIATIEATVRDRLTTAVNTGLLAEDFSVSVPTLDQTTAGDRAARVLKDVKFNARLAGAIKFVEINGVVTA